MADIVGRSAKVAGKVALVSEVLAERGAAACALSVRCIFAWVTAGGDSHVAAANEGGVATLLVTPNLSPDPPKVPADQPRRRPQRPSDG